MKKNIILVVDTSSNKLARVGLIINGTEDFIIRESTVWKSQAVLPLIQELLEKHAVTLQDIQAIQVHAGPGSFTGLRVGAAIANTLGVWLRIPINGKAVGEIVEPVYQ
jgi:tRNA threonylcarbamoyladenosine biosynthesis protein TsaB